MKDERDDRDRRDNGTNGDDRKGTCKISDSLWELLLTRDRSRSPHGHSTSGGSRRSRRCRIDTGGSRNLDATEQIPEVHVIWTLPNRCLDTCDTSGS